MDFDNAVKSVYNILIVLHWGIRLIYIYIYHAQLLWTLSAKNYQADKLDNRIFSLILPI